MLILNDRVAMERALILEMPASLLFLLTKYIGHTIDAGLDGLTRIIVVNADDGLVELNGELGLSLLWDLDGQHWTAESFTPRHDWLEESDGWFIAIVCAGNTGFATIVIVENRDDDLGEFCNRFSRTGDSPLPTNP